MNRDIASSEAPLQVFYNSACPVCRAGISHQRKQDMVGTCQWIDVHQEDAPALPDASKLDDVRERLHVVDEKGKLHIGISAFIKIWRKSPRYRWLARILRLPVIQGCAQAIYIGFAKFLFHWNKLKGHW